jgi:hypothetical protein
LEFTCSVKFDNADDFEIHEVKEHGWCKECAEYFVNELTLMKHLEKEHTDKPNPIKKCKPNEREKETEWTES